MRDIKSIAFFAAILTILACGGTGSGHDDLTAIKSTVNSFAPNHSGTTCNTPAVHIEFMGSALRHNQNDTPTVSFKMGTTTELATFSFGDDSSTDYVMPCLANGTWDVYYDGTKVGTFSVP